MLWVLEENPAMGFYKQLGGQLLSAKKVNQGAVEVAFGWGATENLGE